MPKIPAYMLPRSERPGGETLPDFAERHGWAVRHYADESMGYTRRWRFAKDHQLIDLYLTNDHHQRVSTGDIFHIGIPQGLSSAEMRTRVERAIVGMDCTCTVTETFAGLDRRVDPKCLIHARNESQQVADVRNINVEQATQEALGP